MVGVVVVVGEHTATKVGGVNQDQAGARVGVVQDSQGDLVVTEVRGFLVLEVLEDMDLRPTKITLVVLSSKEMGACLLPPVKRKVWVVRVNKVIISKIKVLHPHFPWRKTRWEVGLRLLDLVTGIRAMVEATGLGRWVAIKVDLTPCLLKSVKIRRTKQKRSLVSKLVEELQEFPIQLRPKCLHSSLLSRLEARHRRMLHPVLLMLQEPKTVKNRKHLLFQELRTGRPASRLTFPSALMLASLLSTRTWWRSF